MSTSEVTEIEGAEHFTDLTHKGTACSRCELTLHCFPLTFGALRDRTASVTGALQTQACSKHCVPPLLFACSFVGDSSHPRQTFTSRLLVLSFWDPAPSCALPPVKCNLASPQYLKRLLRAFPSLLSCSWLTAHLGSVSLHEFLLLWC